MAITALQGLLKTMCTTLGQPRLLGKMAHALCTRFTKRLETPQPFLPKSHVGLVLQRVAELSPEFSSSAYLTDTQLSRLKRVPCPRKVTCTCLPATTMCQFILQGASGKSTGAGACSGSATGSQRSSGSTISRSTV